MGGFMSVTGEADPPMPGGYKLQEINFNFGVNG